VLRTGEPSCRTRIVDRAARAGARSLPLVRPQFAPPPAFCSLLLSNGISLLGSRVAVHLVLGSVRAVRSRGHSHVLRCAAPRPSFQKRYKAVVLYREIVSLFPPTFSCVQ
jgi:hypothetical protein